MRVLLHFQQQTSGLVIGVTYEPAWLEDELARVRRRAFWDGLTGLPNAQALEDELDRHKETSPFSVLVIDFDGMRAANAVFGFREGGDVLIRAVGEALAELTRANEFAARMHTAGDEFAVLLPGATADSAQTRARELERSLDMLEVPQTHRSVYRGASVGAATRRVGETPGRVLGRAIDAMRERKIARRKSKKARHKGVKLRPR